MKRRGFLLVVVSLAMGAVAAFGAKNWLEHRLKGEEIAQSYDVVMAAASDIPYGTKVDARHVTTLNLPKGSAPEAAYRDIEDVVGTVSRANVERGEILLVGRFAAHETGSTLAALISENMRAVTVRVDDVVGVAGFLLPGNRVDVLATKMKRKGGKTAQTETILKNIKVLAVDQTAATEKNDPVIVRAVTLEMTPAQSEILVKAKEEGRIQLTLRNPLEQVAEVEPPKEEPKPVVKPKPRPKRVYAPTSQKVTIIRGTSVNTIKAKI